MFTPFAFIKPEAVSIPSGPPAPFTEDMVFWFKNGSSNISGTTWSNTAGGVVTGILERGASKVGSAARMDASSTRDQNFQIKTSSSTATVRSALILFNQATTTNVSGTARAYFYDARKSLDNTDTNAGFFNQYDSVATGITSCHGNGATFFGYTNGGTPVNGGTITTTLLTNGELNSAGGSGALQYFGPNGTGVNTTRRVFFFNYNPDVPIILGSGGPGWRISNNDNANEGGSMDLFEAIGYNRALSFSEFESLITYLISTGVIS